MQKVARLFSFSTLLTTGLLLSGCANSTIDSTASTLPLGLQSISIAQGNILANSDGMTLYTFDKDGVQQSNCYGPCAQKWPPLISAVDIQDENFTTSARRDGQLQLNYQGHPLYLWIGDKKSGDTLGDGVKSLWHLVNF